MGRLSMSRVDLTSLLPRKAIVLILAALTLAAVACILAVLRIGYNVVLVEIPGRPLRFSVSQEPQGYVEFRKLMTPPITAPAYWRPPAPDFGAYAGYVPGTMHHGSMWVLSVADWAMGLPFFAWGAFLSHRHLVRICPANVLPLPCLRLRPPRPQARRKMLRVRHRDCRKTRREESPGRWRDGVALRGNAWPKGAMPKRSCDSSQGCPTAESARDPSRDREGATVRRAAAVWLPDGRGSDLGAFRSG